MERDEGRDEMNCLEHNHHNRRGILGCTPSVGNIILGQMHERSLES